MTEENQTPTEEQPAKKEPKGPQNEAEVHQVAIQMTDHWLVKFTGLVGALKGTFMLYKTTRNAKALGTALVDLVRDLRNDYNKEKTNYKGSKGTSSGSGPGGGNTGASGSVKDMVANIKKAMDLLGHEGRLLDNASKIQGDMEIHVRSVFTILSDTKNSEVVAHLNAMDQVHIPNGATEITELTELQDKLLVVKNLIVSLGDASKSLESGMRYLKRGVKRHLGYMHIIENDAKGMMNALSKSEVEVEAKGIYDLVIEQKDILGKWSGMVAAESDQAEIEKAMERELELGDSTLIKHIETLKSELGQSTPNMDKIHKEKNIIIHLFNDVYQKDSEFSKMFLDPSNETSKEFLRELVMVFIKLRDILKRINETYLPPIMKHVGLE